MNIVYYKDTDSNAVPVKQFLSKYLNSLHDTNKQKEHKVKMMAKINEVFSIAANNNGIVGGQFSEPLKNCKFQAFRISDGDILNRIFYFCYYREKIVLLNAFEKPDSYDKGLKKKVEKEYIKSLEQTNIYYNKFIRNPKKYEKYK